MKPLLRFDNMLSDYRFLFKSKNFDLFRTFIQGLIRTPHRGTMTQIYLSTEQSTTYWSLPKFLSRSKWSVDKLTSALTRQVQDAFGEGVYVYDETHSCNNGLKQFGTHFFKNTRYNTRNKNQSKFKHGHQFGAIGWLCETPEGVRLFPLAARVMCPKKKRDNSFAVLKRLCALMPRGLIIFDRGIMYVNWQSRWELFGFGFGRRISGKSGHPDDFGEPFGPDEPKIPKGIKIFDMSEGIDPYKLLNLPKK